MADANDGRVTLFNAPGSSIFGTERRTSAQREYIARPRPADDASGAEAMRVAAALNKVAKAAGYERAWVAPSGEPNIILERKHPTSEGMIQVTRLDLCVGARDDAVEEARDAVVRAADLLSFSAHPSSDLPDRYIVHRVDMDALRAALRREKGGA